MTDRKTYKIEQLAEKVGIGPFGSSIKVETFVDSGIPVISGTHLKGYRLEDGNYNFIKEEHANKLINANVKRGDVIFTHAGNISSVAYIPSNSKYERYILSQRQFYLRCNTKLLLPEYITYYFKTPYGQKQLLANSSSVGVPSIAQPVTYLRSIEVSIPDIEEQRNVVEILSSLDDKIELNLQMNQTLEAMAQAIFKEWFVNFNFPGFDGELVDGLPKGWNRCLIKDFGKIVCGKTPSKAVKEYFGGEYMFIKIPDMHNSVFIIETTDSLTEEGLNSQSNKTIPPFSICVSSIATVGLVCINPEPCQTNQQINSIVPKNKDSRYFLYFLTTSMKDTFLATASGGTATLNMNTSQFSNIGAFMPGEDILKEFDVIVSPIMEKILENEYNIKSLTQTRDTLLPKLMSGQLKIV